jgi:NDP-4-keto-2,6-dideoxyhexose 3-C-methyltransferase
MTSECKAPNAVQPDYYGNCRICASDELRPLFNLGQLASCGVFPAANEPDPPTALLELVQCARCFLEKLRHNFKRDDLFRHAYGYRSGINESMKAHLQSLVDISRRAELRAGDTVLDIGSNDGTTLASYKVPDLIRVGIEHNRH